jgi:hypothetical protein
VESSRRKWLGENYILSNRIDQEAEVPVTGTGTAKFDVLSRAILFFGLATALFSLALTIRCYVRCPVGDEWFAIDSIAKGAGIFDWPW